LDTIVFLCEHFGFDFVLIETVGSGQGETAVRAIADGVVLLLHPETGDDLQWEKAGVLEVADLIVVHKADLAGADRTVSQIQSMLALSAGREVRVLTVSSKSGAGLPELLAALQALPARKRDEDDAARLLKLAQEALAERFRHGD